MTGPKLVVAMDFDSLDAALAVAAGLDPGSCRLKVGHQLYASAGPLAVRSLQEEGFEIFLDLKFHDIPNTVAGACRAAADLGVWMVNVHAAGGPVMLEAAAESVHSTATLVTAVTILTSFDQAQFEQVGYSGQIGAQVVAMAKLAQQSGVDGVVCSAQEISMLRAQVGADFLLVTPGIRPKGAARGDQKRVMTPGQAIATGSNFLVVGRPITQAANPAGVVMDICNEIAVADQ